MRVRTGFLAMLILIGGVLSAGSSPQPGDGTACGLRSIAFRVNGVAAPLLSAGGGDEVTVTFEVPDGCEHELTLASFVAPAPAFDGSRLDDQVLFSRERGTFGAGRHSLTVHVFDFVPVAPATCAAERAEAEAERDALRQAVQRAMAASPSYRERVVELVGRNRLADEPHPNGPYAGSCDASETSLGSARGRPCDGCVGKADDKDPPGQVVPGTDSKAGYGCDRKAGIGKAKPAHSGCPNFQLDFAYSAVEVGNRSRLIAGLFCVRPEAECYVTDRTGGDAVVGSHEPASRRP